MYRKLRGLTQAQLAEKSGVAAISIHQYETGKRQPRFEQVSAIADALGVLVTQLVDFSDVDISTHADKLSSNVLKTGVLLKRARETLDELRNQGAPLEEIKRQEDLCEQMSKTMLEGGNLLTQGNQTQKLYEKMLLVYFNYLNEEGQVVAVDRLKELSEIPRYCKDERLLQETEKKSQDEAQDGESVSESDTE